MENTFGELLRKYRLRAGIGLRRFAVLINEAPENQSATEHGRRQPPRNKEKLRLMAETLGLSEGSADWERFFDAAARPGEFPADVGNLANRKLVPVLLRTINDLRPTNDQLEKLVNDLTLTWRTKEDGTGRPTKIHSSRDRKKSS